MLVQWVFITRLCIIQIIVVITNAIAITIIIDRNKINDVVMVAVVIIIMEEVASVVGARV